MLVFREKLWYTDKCESMNRCPGFQGSDFSAGSVRCFGLQKEGLDLRVDMAWRHRDSVTGRGMPAVLSWC